MLNGARIRVLTATMLLTIVAALMAQTGSQAQGAERLRFTRGFLVTGNFLVGGVDLPRAGGTGTINFTPAHANQLPAESEVIAAYLVWETIEPAENPRFEGALFRGQPIDVVKATRTLSVPQTGAACWGGSGGISTSLTIYRADVLHQLPKQYDAEDKWTGRYLLNDADLIAHGLPLHSVTLPSYGTGDRATINAGASLVVVYRNPTEPLRKILLFDGLETQVLGTTNLLSISGFYRAAASASAKLTYIAATGGHNSGERVVFNGAVVATNPFPAPIDGASDRGWANPTFDVSALVGAGRSTPGFGQTATSHLDHGPNNVNASPYDCPVLGGVVFSTAVADVDRDGLPDAIEESADGMFDPPTPLDRNAQRLPNLHAMGARVGQRDLFVEINAMTAAPGTTYGSADAPYNATTTSVTDADGHDHMPSPKVLTMVAHAYIRGGITPHFDIGNVEDYQALFPCAAGDSTCDASAYLVPSEHARGGERILERACTNCQFDSYPGTVGWPYGLQLYRDAPVNHNGEEMATLEAIEDGFLENNRLRRRFDRIRHDYVHYALYAHARGKAKSPFPCLDAAGEPTGYADVAARSCAVSSNPQFKVPSSASGVASLPGSNVLVTLGLWDSVDFIGSDFLQASTSLHELGHNGDLWHGGRPATFGMKALGTSTVVEPNCKPNYLSSMSYLFQAHGLFDNSGNVHLDYSAVPHGTLSEGGLSDSGLFPAAQYRAAWFAPATSPLALDQDAGAARRFCSGARFDTGAPTPSMARVLAGTTDAVIDWDGQPSTASSAGDVNFDGIANVTLEGYNDWANFRLDQIGATRTARLFSSASGDLIDFGSGDLIDFGSGDLLDFGSGDLLDFGSGTHIVHMGSGDFFRYGAGDLIDFGSGDLIDFGSGDLIDFGSGVLMFVGADGDLIDFGAGDLLDFGSGDLIDFGSGDLIDFGSGDLLDFGSGDLIDFGSGDLLDFGSGTGLVELDFDMAVDLEVPRISGLTACVLGVDCAPPQPAAGEPNYHRIKLNWVPPPFLPVAAYDIYRSSGGTAPVLIGSSTVPMFIDSEDLPHEVEFSFTVQARFVNGRTSPISDSVEKTAVNVPPVAVNDEYATSQGVALAVPALGVLANDSDVDSAASARRAVTVASAPANGSLALNANGAFVYTPSPAFFGTDVFTYVADNGVWSRDPSVALSGLSNAATVLITVVRPPNVPPVCSNLSASVVTGGSVRLSASCTDADGNPLTVTGVGTASRGTVMLNADKTFTYTATSPNVGPDSFTYTVSDGLATATATANIQVIYKFVNVQNVPPSKSAKFNSGSAIPIRWQWANNSGTPLNTAAAGARVDAYACSTSGALPGAYPTGTFSPELPGSGNSFSFNASTNSWQFNWKLIYSTGSATYNLPAGTYVLQVRSTVTGQTDPGTLHNCADGTTVRGALLEVK